MDIVKKDIRDDIKFYLTFKNVEGIIRNPLDTPFVVSLFSILEDMNSGKRSKKSIWHATYDGETLTNCEVENIDVDGGEPIQKLLVKYNYDREIYKDSGFFKVGKLKCTVFPDYPDMQMPDEYYTNGKPVDLGVEIINIDFI